MPKFHEVFPDTQESFDKFISQIDSLNDVAITVIGNNRLKEVVYNVNKASELLKYRSNDDVIIQLNEEIFEQLDDELQKMVIEEAVARIYYDDEKGKITIIKPDVNTFSLFLRKYGYEKYEVLQESVKTLFAAKEQENAENNVEEND
jgi:hypothetical protein